MTDWDGRGLPPVAAARVQRFTDSHLRTSLLTVPAAASLEAVGFDTVGEVMGTIVQRISFAGYGGCGMWSGSPYAYGYNAPQATTVQSSSASRFSGYGPYVQALNTGYDTALRRMLLEASALGADGVVGVSLTTPLMEGQAREFIALGTAVRARSRVRPAHPFTTDLPGTDFAKLVLAGWIPVALQVGLEVAIRHDDWRTQSQAGAGAGWLNTANVEVSGYTELVQHTRGLARDKLARKIASAGADGGIVRDMSLHIWEIEPGERHRDHVAEAMITGTAIARFRRSGPPPASTLTMLPVSRGRAERAGRPRRAGGGAPSPRRAPMG